MGQKKKSNSGNTARAQGVTGSMRGSKDGASDSVMSLTDKMGKSTSKGASPPPLPKLGGASKASSARDLPPKKADATSAKASVSKGSGASDDLASLAAPLTADDLDDTISESGSRRAAQRRPAGPVRERIAANDDAPSIGGLIYSLQEKPSRAPLKYAAIGSAIWGIVGLGYASLAFWSDLQAGMTLSQFLVNPLTFLTFTAIVVPIAVIWFLAVLAWRSEELRLRSSTMTEVAVRLAEPDRLAEQSVASLGQAVRRQVSFMNEAVSRALGRAGELEALVHNEVSALENSYEVNERKIRALIDELAHERSALAGTGGDFADTLRSMSEDVPALIEKLTGQQSKLAGIIASAGDNLTTLETSLGSRTEHLEQVLGSYSGNIDAALAARTQQIHGVLEDHATKMDAAFDGQADSMRGMLGQRTEEMSGILGTYTTALADALGERTAQIETSFNEHMTALDSSIEQRTDNLQTVFEEYGLALDATLANRADVMDSRLIERTRALDDAFNQRLQIFDESIKRSTDAIDMAVGEKAHALTSALESHATTFRETITQQSADLDESLVHGINAVRRSSENITRQSLKAIEGLAGQSDLLKNVSENLLGQINSVSNRFDSQTQSIMSAANSLESANHKIDSTLRSRHTELSSTLDRLSGTAEEFGRFVEGYSTSIEGSLNDAEQRARSAAIDFKAEAESQQESVLANFERLRSSADQQSSKVLEDLRARFVTVQDELTSQLGSMSQKVEGSTDDLRQKAAIAAQAIVQEQGRLREELAAIPTATREGTESMRRALQDQLKALERLSAISSAHAKEQDVRSPVATSTSRGLSGPVRSQFTKPDEAPTRGLSSLSTSVARELAARTSPQRPAGPISGNPGPRTQPAGPTRAQDQTAGRRAPTPPPVQDPKRGLAPPSAAQSQGVRGTAPPVTRTAGSAPGVRRGAPGAPGQGGDRWSLGDLLQNASFDDEGGVQNERAQVPSSNQQRAVEAQNGPEPGPGALDLAQLARAIDPRTAAQIWERLRKGEKGFLARAMYEPEGRIAFDDVAHRVKADPGVKTLANGFMDEFEKSLRAGDFAQASSEQVLARLTSDAGRIYLFLAHVTGRLG